MDLKIYYLIYLKTNHPIHSIKINNDNYTLCIQAPNLDIPQTPHNYSTEVLTDKQFVSIH